ncbi:alpha/beta hydrolase [Cryptosporangium phraense]|uniref:Alpha/beta hydrolase n=1 Tax=Cryptosporangium phraense TaxID=2593070 RepID=A0A545AXN9_9ACTN|nr:alpha/beta hydrolase [Cryptosporangium phraense]TQS46068.1 alpha/beta hydrolase [Cryptosporangium phraense]
MADAVVIPGRLFGPGAPTLMYAGDVAARRGATVHRHSWAGSPPVSLGAERVEWVRGEVAGLLDSVDGTPLLIGKSLGSLAAPLAAERGLPAVWLTPLLTEPWAVSALAAATAPFLLIGGTGDRVWDGPAARRLTPHVLEIPDADHGLYVPGPLTASVEVLARIVVAVETFLDAIRWPG